ncbi:MAG: M20/M25/M40 family metallo-hydrolase [Methanomicrobiales archaeon]|jgi:acetylornithine deacetylase/succinyl-diaminopimelate desuccinylase-like protein
MKESIPKFRQITATIKDIRRQYEEDLSLVVSVPSVSSEPDRFPDVRRCADVAAGLLRRAGATAEVVPTGGHPVVHASLVTDPGNPTVALYNHLDVQPADPGEWSSDPFTLTIHRGRYTGRGATDDKGPALAAMTAAALARDAGIPLNYHFLWELEEEIGSPHFASFLRERKRQIPADSVMVSDTIWVARATPSIPYGLRGLLPATLSLQTARSDVHSGVAGGVARNPLLEISELLTRCCDAETGRVKIPGFYKGVRRPRKGELERSLAVTGFTAKGFARDLGLTSIRPNLSTDLDVVKAFSMMPTFEVHGITGGYTGPGSKAIVPHRAEAKVSMRLVPGQDPIHIARLFREFVKRQNPDIRVKTFPALQPYLGDHRGPYARAARSAISAAFGKEPAFTREGGSIGAVVAMDRILRVPISFLGLSLPSHGYHSRNEHFDWGQASGGIRMFLHYFGEIARIRPPRRRRTAKG